MSFEENSTFYQYCVDKVVTGDISMDYSHWFLIPAVAIIAILSFLERRKFVKPSLFGGRPALVSPFGFLDEPRNRWGIMFVFGSLTGNIIRVLSRTFTNGVEFPVWAEIFRVYILCLEVSVITYPLFACMTNRHKLIGAVTGLVYALGWIGFKLFAVILTIRCYSKLQNPEVDSDITAFHIVIDIPVFICNFLVVLKFSLKLYKCLRKGVRYGTCKDPLQLCKSYHLTYVKHLLRRHDLQQYGGKRLSMVGKIRHMIMRPVPGFRFPLSIMITIFMSAIMLYSISIASAFLMDSFAKLFHQFQDFQGILQAANVVATTLTILSGIRNIYSFLINYRTDMLSLYKGDKSFIPASIRHSSPQLSMARGMRFIGTSITGMVWGSILCYLMVYIPLAAMMVVIKVLVANGKIKYLLSQLEWLVYPVCMIIIFKMQTFFIGRFFMQPKIHANDRHRPLAVDNRNAFNVFSFFMVYLNASIGLFTFMKRILLGALLGVFLIPRMDRSLLMNGYEDMDKCYVNYIGMIIVDSVHNHPVLRVFCFLLKSQVEDKKFPNLPNFGEQAAYYIDRNSATGSTNNIRRRRWWLAYTLIRNPSLSALRVHEAIMDTPGNSPVDLEEIQCSDSELKDQATHIMNCSCTHTCCKDFKSCVPKNLVTNLFAVLVLLSIIIFIAGISSLGVTNT